MAEKDKTGKELERRVADLYRSMGAWKVEHDVELAGNQIDTYVELRPVGSMLHRIAVEAKDWASPVGIDVVNDFAKVVKAIRDAGLVDEGIIVSPSGFSKQGRSASKTHGIRLLDIADLESQAEQASTSKESPVAVASTIVAPQPYLAHPYSMPKNWVGRRNEMDRMDEWLMAGDPPMLCLIAYGGTGKSSLAWNWLFERVVPKQEELGLSGIFQWSFYEGEVSFQRFLDELTGYLGASTVSDPVTAIIQRLQQTRVLLILDGFERLLLEYNSPECALAAERPAEEIETNQRRCAELRISRFLQALASHSAGKVLVTTRLVPQEIDGREGWLPIYLQGLDTSDAVAFLRNSGIGGTDRELEDAGRVYDFHPLSLDRLVNAIHYDLTEPDDVRAAMRHDVSGDLQARQRHIFERAYETLPRDMGQLLSSFAALRGQASMDVVRFLADGWPMDELSSCLQRLEEDRWIQWKREEQIVVMHPIVRRYVYSRLLEKQHIHARLAEHFTAKSKVTERQIGGIAGLAKSIEMYHHLVLAGRHEDGFKLFRQYLHQPLHYWFGAYQTCIELILALFPQGDTNPPLMTVQTDQAWLMNSLANSYNSSGQSQKSLTLTQVAITMADNSRNLAVGLGVLSGIQMQMGQLSAASANIHQSTTLCQEANDKFNEAAARMELGRQEICLGAFDEANRNLTSVASYFRDNNQLQCESVVRAHLAMLDLLKDDVDSALVSARKSLSLARRVAAVQSPFERDFVEADWLIGRSQVALARKDRQARKKLLKHAASHLTDALTRCRRINLVQIEPDILLSWACYHRMRHDAKQSNACAGDALAIADRCEYRLKQADAHNLLAQLDIDEGDKESAITHAQTARERAWCDGPPFCYKPALDEAERLLKELGAQSPVMPTKEVK